MANMSYCRFQNTSRDLYACQLALENLFAGEGEKLSADELRAAKALLQTCLDIAELVADQYGIDLSKQGVADLESNADQIIDDANEGVR